MKTLINLAIILLLFSANFLQAQCEVAIQNEAGIDFTDGENIGELCLGTTYTFRASAETELFYNWNDNTGDESSFSIVPDEVTTVVPDTLRLIVDSGSGCMDTTFVIYQVIAPAGPVFDNLITVFCGSDASYTLPMTSANDIAGNWEPSTIDPATDVSPVTAVFTPSSECANSFSITVEINPIITPEFNSLELTPCSSDEPYGFPAVSDNGIMGTWSPAIIDPSVNSTAVFTPDNTECSEILTVSISPEVAKRSGEVVSNMVVECAVTDQSFLDLSNNLSNFDEGGNWLINNNSVSSSIDLSNYPAGTYTVVYRFEETGNCPSIATEYTLEVISRPSISSATGNTPSTCGGSDGSIDVEVSNNGLDYEIGYSVPGNDFIWVVGSPTSLSGLLAGEYELFIRYSNEPMCQGIEGVSVDIQDPNGPDASIESSSSNNSVCLDGVIQLSAVNQLADSQYEWVLDGGVTSSSLSSPELSDVSWNTSGDKTVSLTIIRNGCSSTSSIEITVNELPEAMILTSQGVEYNCNYQENGLSLTVAEVNGNNYTWTKNGSFFAEGAVALANGQGTYTVMITNSGTGCIAMSSVEISENLQAPVAAIEVIGTSSELNCEIGTITLTATPSLGEFEYNWQGPGQNTATGSSVMVTLPGSFSVEVTDTNNGCAAESSLVEITEDRVFPIVSLIGDEGEVLGESIGLSCDNPTEIILAQVESSVSTSYNWSNGSGSTAINLDSGSPLGAYSVTVTNGNNRCETVESVTLSKDFAAPQFDLSSSDEDDSVCQGAGLGISVLLGNGVQSRSISWASNGLSLTPDSDNSTEVAVPTETSGLYTVIATVVDSGNGCPNTKMIDLEIFANPTIEDINFSAVSAGADSENSICLNGQAEFQSEVVSSGSEITMYNWTLDGQSVGNGANLVIDGNTVSERSYQLTVMDNNGCIDESEEVFVDVLGLPVATIEVNENSGSSPGDGEVCQGESLTLSVNIISSPNNGGDYLWSDGSENQTITIETSSLDDFSYSITVTDSEGCQTNDIQNITVHPLPSFTVDVLESSGVASNDGNVCAGEVIEFIASDTDLAYEWIGQTENSNVLMFMVGNTSGDLTQEVNASNIFGCESEVVVANYVVNTNPSSLIDDEDLIYQVNNGGVFRSLMETDVEYTWMLTGVINVNSTGSELPVSFPVSGGLDVVLNALNTVTGCSSNTTENTEVVDGACLANFQLPAGDLCARSDYNISNTSISGTGQAESIKRAEWRFLKDGVVSSTVIISNDNDTYTFDPATGIFQFDDDPSSGINHAFDNLENINFPTGGDWEVELTVSSELSNGCLNTRSRGVSILRFPELANFSVDQSTVCAGDPLTLSFTSGVNDPYSVTYQRNDQFFTVDVTNNEEVTIGNGLLENTTFVISEISTMFCSNEEVFPEAINVSVNQNPTEVYSNFECDISGEVFTAEYLVNTQNNIDVSLTSPTGIAANQQGDTLVIDSLIVGFQYPFVFTDANGCSYQPETVEFFCDCTKEIGDWIITEIKTCENTAIDLPFPGSFEVDETTALEYRIFNDDVDTSILYSEPTQVQNPPNIVSPEDLGLPPGDYTLRISIAAYDSDNDALNEDDACAGSIDISLRVLPRPEVSFIGELDSLCGIGEATVNINIDYPLGTTTPESFLVRYTANTTLFTRTYTMNGLDELASGIVTETTLYRIQDVTAVEGGDDGLNCSTFFLVDNAPEYVVRVDTLPRPNITLSTEMSGDGSDITVCQGTELTVVLEADYPVVNWTIGDLMSSESELIFNANSESDIFVDVVDDNGCSGTGDRDVDITPPPMPTIIGDLSICEGAYQIPFSSSTFNENNSNFFTWNNTELANAGVAGFEDENSGNSSEIFLVFPNGSNSYQLILTEQLANDESCIGRDTVEVSTNGGIAPPPVNIVLLDAGNILVADNDAIQCYQWGFDTPDGTFTEPGETFQAYAAGESFAPDERSYWVDVWTSSNPDNCGNSQLECATRTYYNRQFVPLFRLDNGSEEDPVEFKVLLAPNPNRGYFDLLLENAPTGTYRSLVYNSSGQLLSEQTDFVNDLSYTIDFQSNLPAGMYFLRLVNAETGIHSTHSFIVQP